METGTSSADPRVTRSAEMTRVRFMPIRFTRREAPQPPTKKKIAAGGRNASPVSRGEYPRVPCRYTVRRRNPPDEAVIRSESTFASRIVLRRTKARGMRGDSDRCSIARKTASTAAERARGTAVSIVKSPTFAAFVSAYTSRTSPVVTVTAPGTSRRAPDARPGSLTMYRFARSAAAAPMGTFTNITDLHPNAVVRAPPRIDPAANPAESTATTTPKALFRAGPSGYVAAKIAIAVAIVNAEGVPGTPRDRL